MIALYKGKSLISRTIKWFTWGPYAHASWILPDQSCIEAWHVGGVRHTKHWCMDHKPGTEIDFFEIKGMPPEQRKVIEAFLLDQVGKRYYFWGIARFFSRRRNRRRTRNPKDVGRWFCSELVMAACQKAGVDLLKRVEPQQVHPTLLSYSPNLDHVKTRKTWRVDNEYYPSIDRLSDPAAVVPRR